MANRSETPVIALTAAVLVFFAGGFLLLLDAGRSARESERLHFEPGSGAAAPAETSTYFGDVEKGGEIIKEKAETFLDELFSGTAGAPADPGRAKTARGRSEDAAPAGDPEGDAFERYFKKNYAKLFDEEAEPSSGAGDGQFGGGRSAGASGDGAAEKVSPRANQQKGAAAASAAADSPAPPPGARPIFGGPASKGPAGAPQRSYASLPEGGGPSHNASNSPSPAWSPGGYAGGGGAKPQKDGGLSGLPGNGSGGAIGGGAESMRAGAQSNYNSKMSGGAAAVKAGGSGSSSPEASKPAKAETDKKSAATRGGSDAETDSGAQPYADAQPAADPGTAANEAQDLVRTVVADKLNGKDLKLVSADDAAGAPEEALLKPGALAGDAEAAPGSAPEPEDLSALPAERQAALKKEIHVFLKQVESKYGAMADITYSSCATFPDVCKAHGLTANYLTMKTKKGVTLVMGLKYVNGKWRRYTLDFKDPNAGPAQPPPDDNSEDESQG